MGKKRALLVGINYPNTPNELYGCVNDVMIMSQVLTQFFGFTNPKDKRMLTNQSATTANIKERLEWLVDGAQPGDVLYFHYSGHGSQVVASKYDTDMEPDGLDEIICPIDLDWRDHIIYDDDFRTIFNKVPTGVNLTVVLDCCHSGSGIDSKNIFQPGGLAKVVSIPKSPNKSRLLPMPPDIANRGIGLSLQPKPRNVGPTDAGLLISGCQSHQQAEDAWIHNKFMGVATFFLIENLRKNKWDIDYKKLVSLMNRDLKKCGYAQAPELNGTQSLFGGKFLK